jgi:hypothetical protein
VWPALLQALESSLAEAFDCALDHGLITITSSLPGGGDVADLWGAMELAGIADRHLEAIASTCCVLTTCNMDAAHRRSGFCIMLCACSPIL